MNPSTAFGVFVAGILAGSLGGFLGIGGGVVLMPVLRFVLGLSPAMAAGTCVMAVTFTTLGGAHKHYQLGNVDLKSVLPIILSGGISAAAFSLVFPLFARHGHERWLDIGTGMIFFAISLRMIIEGLRGDEPGRVAPGMLPGATWAKVAVGSAAGTMPGLLGIGTGALLVPVFVLILNAPMKIAVGSSLACFFAFALLSSVFKAVQGFVDLQLVIPLCLGTLLGSGGGAWLTKSFKGATLKVAFGFAFLFVSVKYLLLFFGARI
ncbi:MAG: sulfite exporter TauE/SafE family protein [Elusimicrobiota bacterium]